jgi:hypothetical protein
MGPPRMSRRTALLLGGAAGALALLSRMRVSRAAPSLPHFFLGIQLRGGVDNAYLFDGRGPKVTDKNLKANYLLRNDARPGSTMPTAFTASKVLERTIACELTGCSLLRTPLVDALWAAHKDHLSIVNGVYMLERNVGHESNAAYLWGNGAVGGRPIFTPVIGQTTPSTPLDSVVFGDWPYNPPPSNVDTSAQLSSQDLGALTESLRSGRTIDEDSPLFRALLARSDQNAGGDGLFSAGAARLGRGLRGAKRTTETLALARWPDDSTPDKPDTLSETVRKTLALFSSGATHVASIIHRGKADDAHSAESCQNELVEVYRDFASELHASLDALRSTMYLAPNGDRIPFLDLTTYVITSEFGRTNRSVSEPRQPVGATGADHNPLANSVLVGGRGIVGGLVVGESDLVACDDRGTYQDVSGAHRQMNPALDAAMGRPFDFEAQRGRRDLPERFDSNDYIHMPSVINTLLDVFDVPQSERLQRDRKVAPLLRVLRRSVG